MTYEQPRRLRDEDEFGALLHAAEVDTITAERLARNAAGLKALIASGATTALRKLIVPLVILSAVLVPLIGYLVREPAGAPSSAASLPEHAVHDTVDEPGIRASAIARETIVAVEEPPTEPKHASPPPASASAPVVAPLAEPPAVPAPSDLPEQIRLYEAARDAARRGNHADAIARIDDLLQRFPNTQLRADAQLTRTESLVRANRFDEAVAALEQLVGDDAHRGRRGELLRTLGDLHRRHGDCAHAVDAYTRALALRLDERSRNELVRARDLCTPR